MTHSIRGLFTGVYAQRARPAAPLPHMRRVAGVFFPEIVVRLTTVSHFFLLTLIEERVLAVYPRP
jgi:hypothetical protein